MSARLFSHDWCHDPGCHASAEGQQPVGYTYLGNPFCLDTCVVWDMNVGREHENRAEDTGVEAALDVMAAQGTIDRSDEASFDSADFPKVLRRHQLTVHPEYCAMCERRIGQS